MEVFSFCQNPCTNELIIVQILSIPPLQFPSQSMHLCVQTTMQIWYRTTIRYRKVFCHATSKPYAKSNSKGRYTNSESDIWTGSLQDTIRILKNKLVNVKNTIKNLSIIFKNITSNTYEVSPSNKKSGNEPMLLIIHQGKSWIKFLRILTEKKYRQIKLQRLQKVGIWAFGSLMHHINSL